MEKSDIENWVFSPDDLQNINQKRLSQQSYLFGGHKQFLSLQEENNLINFYCQFIIEAIRTRNLMTKKIPFLSLKITFTAITLFKRFFFKVPIIKYRQFPEQIILISIYLAFKLEEIHEANINQLVNSLKKKSKYTRFVHFNDPNYSNKEFFLLEQINYNIYFKNLFRPIEAMLHQIKENKNIDKGIKIQLEKDIFDLASKVYLDQIIFEFPISCISMSLINIVLKKKNLQVSEVFKENVKNLFLEKQNIINQAEERIISINFDQQREDVTKIKSIHRQILNLYDQQQQNQIDQNQFKKPQLKRNFQQFNDEKDEIKDHIQKNQRTN